MDQHAKTFFLVNPIAGIFLGLSAVFVHAGNSLASRHLAREDVVIERFNSTAIVKLEGKVICKISPIDEYAWTNTPIRISTDGESVMFSSMHYSFFSDFKRCGGMTMRPRSVGRLNGALIDINAKTQTYLSIDIAAAKPIVYIANFGRLDGREMKFRPKGVRTNRFSLDQRRAFDGVDEMDPKGRISLNGRYMSAVDIPDCSKFAYPGVWDLAKERTVLIEEGSSEEIRKKCESLFSMP